MTLKSQIPLSSGVDELIQKLKNQGIAAGQEEAEQIIAEAELCAERIVREAELKAEQLVREAERETEAIKSSGQDALRLAARDAFLSLQDQLNGLFAGELSRIVGCELSDETLLKQIIIELAGQVRSEIGLDDRNVFGIQVAKSRQGADIGRQDLAKTLALALTSGLLRSGVSIEIGDEPKSGLRIVLDHGKVLVDFSDETITALLLERLQPCFRDLLEGAGE